MERSTKKLMNSLEKKRLKKAPESVYLTEMRDWDNAVEFENLRTCFFTEGGTVRSVDGVSFSVPMGKTVCIVGESGCGKSVTSLSLMQLLQRPQGQILSGQIRLNLGNKAYDIAKTPEPVMETLRGSVMSMIFQEPMTALNPVLTVGAQLRETAVLHKKDPEKVLSLLETVGIPNPEGVARMYPHNLSGGMRQRICIAMALVSDPRLIIADEPTTALDVTVQAQILAILRDLKERTGCAVMLITHDLGVVAQMADLVVVMYAGRVVEMGTTEEIFYHPAHPYTLGLMAAKPVVGKTQKRLFTIPGQVPSPVALPDTCYFKDRCDRWDALCHGPYPELITLSPTHKVSCHRQGGM